MIYFGFLVIGFLNLWFFGRIVVIVLGLFGIVGGVVGVIFFFSLI